MSQMNQRHGVNLGPLHVNNCTSELKQGFFIPYFLNLNTDRNWTFIFCVSLVTNLKTGSIFKICCMTFFKNYDRIIKNVIKAILFHFLYDRWTHRRKQTMTEVGHKDETVRDQGLFILFYVYVALSSLFFLCSVLHSSITMCYIVIYYF